MTTNANDTAASGSPRPTDSGLSYIIHFTTNTGHSQKIPASHVQPGTFNAISPLLNAPTGESVDVPGLPGWTFRFDENSAMFPNTRRFIIENDDMVFFNSFNMEEAILMTSISVKVPETMLRNQDALGMLADVEECIAFGILRQQAIADAIGLD